MRKVRFQDHPWQRLPWLIPSALIGASIALMGFMRLLMQLPIGPTPPRPIDVQLVELSVPAAAVPAAPSPPEPVVKEEPPPELIPEPVTLPPPVVKEEPSAEVKAEATPEKVIPPAPKKPPPARRAAPTKPTVAPPPRPQAPQEAAPDAQPIARAPVASAPPGGNLGARAIYKPMPEIPEEFRRRNVEWVAVARFRVAADGSAQVELIEATSEPTLNRVLLDSLKRWRFFPATENGRPVGSTIDIRIPIAVR